MSPLVSVILPTHNRASTIARAIDSVLAQSCGDFELIIVDDCSLDDTECIVMSYRDERIKWFKSKRTIGQAAARNAGIKEARSPLVAFQDSDDAWLPEKLSKQLAIFAKESSDLGVVYSDMTRVSKDGTEKYFAAPTIRNRHLVNRETGQYTVCNIGILSAMIKMACFKQVGFFDERLRAYEDLELFMRLSVDFRFYHMKEALVRYYETDGVSADIRAQAQARRMILDRYSKELLGDKWFIAKELAFLKNIERREHE